jgi:hypothetical protein
VWRRLRREGGPKIAEINYNIIFIHLPLRKKRKAGPLCAQSQLFSNYMAQSPVANGTNAHKEEIMSLYQLLQALTRCLSSFL